MPYTKTTWVEGSAPGISAAELNRMETQYDEAVQSFPVGLFDPFVLTGCTAVVNATVANQLDFTGGTAYPKQADGTLRKRDPANATFTTSVASTTYYLDLNPDGTLSWGTAHSAQANYMPLYEVLTDASANISTVTDVAQRQANLLPALASAIKLAGIQPVNKAGDTMTGALFLPFVDIGSSPNGSIELGKRDGNASTPFIDFHSGATVVDYDARIIASGGTGSSGGGSINIVSANVTINSNKIWHAGNDGAGSGLDADTVDGQHASAFALASTAAKIVIGSYTGDGTTGRTINLGITPKLIFLYWQDSAGSYNYSSMGLPSTANGKNAAVQIYTALNAQGVYGVGDDTQTNQDKTLKIVTNGFLVMAGGVPAASSTNYNGQTYNYIAIY